MANKIKEVIQEPSKLTEGSSFKLRIKAIMYMTCREMKIFSCTQAKEYTCGQVKGEN